MFGIASRVPHGTGCRKTSCRCCMGWLCGAAVCGPRPLPPCVDVVSERRVQVPRRGDPQACPEGSACGEACLPCRPNSEACRSGLRQFCPLGDFVWLAPVIQNSLPPLSALMRRRRRAISSTTCDFLINQAKKYRLGRGRRELGRLARPAGRPAATTGAAAIPLCHRGRRMS